MIMGIDVISIIFYSLMYAVPVLLCAGLIKVLFMLHRAYRDRKSLAAFKDDEVAVSIEKDRIKARRIGALGVILWPAVFAAGIYAQIPIGAALVIATTCCCVCFWQAGIVRSRYSAGFKENIVKAELSKVFDNLQYEPNGKLDSATLRGIDFFKTYDLMGGNDLIAAEYKGMRFEQCDLRVEKEHVTETDKGKEVEWSDVFRGRAMRFDFAEKFRGRVQVVKRNFDSAKVTSWLRGNWQSVETEFAAFNDHFEVFALDPPDAMAVLTPQMIEGIFYLNNALNAPMAFYFTDNRMFAFISMKREVFDASGKHTLLEERELIRKDIKLITTFLDTMYFKRQETGSSPVVADGSEAYGSDAHGNAAPPPVERPSPLRDPAMDYSAFPAGGRSRYMLEKMATPSGLLIAAYLVSAVYTLVKYPYSIPDHGLEDIPTLAYVVGAGFFVCLPALAGSNRSKLIALAAFAIHLIFIL